MIEKLSNDDKQMEGILSVNDVADHFKQMRAKKVNQVDAYVKNFTAIADLADF